MNSWPQHWSYDWCTFRRLIWVTVKAYFGPELNPNEEALLRTTMISTALMLARGGLRTVSSRSVGGLSRFSTAAAIVQEGDNTTAVSSRAVLFFPGGGALHLDSNSFCLC